MTSLACSTASMACRGIFQTQTTGTGNRTRHTSQQKKLNTIVSTKQNTATHILKLRFQQQFSSSTHNNSVTCHYTSAKTKCEVVYSAVLSVFSEAGAWLFEKGCLGTVVSIGCRSSDEEASDATGSSRRSDSSNSSTSETESGPSSGDQ